MSVGQQTNPVWLDMRQWRVTSSNLVKYAINRQIQESYPPSFRKTVLGDYGTPHCNGDVIHERDAIQQYTFVKIWSNFHGLNTCMYNRFLSVDYPFSATSPDGVIQLRIGSKVSI